MSPSARSRDPHRRRRLLFAAVLLPSLTAMAVAAVGCGDASGGLGIGPPSGGSLGQVNMFPECGAFSQACIQNGLNSPLAVDAKLGLGVDFRVGGSSGPPTGLETTNGAVAIVEDGVITAVGEGPTGVLITGPDGRVIDFIHLWVAEASDLRIVRYNDSGLPLGAIREEGTLLVGDEILVSIEAFKANQPLLGLFKATWTSEVLESEDEGAEPIAVVDDIVFGWYRIVARAPGKVRLNANALGLDKTLELEVVP